MKGALLVNLGSPDSTDVKDVKKYLKEFLMDERVIDEPLWLRTLLVKGIILNFRPKKSAKAYKKIWWEEGSPLIVLSYKLLEKIQVFDISGRLMNTSHSDYIDISSFSDGIYIINLESDGNKFQTKFVKE